MISDVRTTTVVESRPGVWTKGFFCDVTSNDTVCTGGGRASSTKSTLQYTANTVMLHIIDAHNVVCVQNATKMNDNG
jgi:hypothetical protein